MIKVESKFSYYLNSDEAIKPIVMSEVAQKKLRKPQIVAFVRPLVRSSPMKLSVFVMWQESLPDLLRVN